MIRQAHHKLLRGVQLRTNPWRALQSGLVLQATDSEAARSVVTDHEGIATVEVQEPWVCSTHRATPIVAVRADIAERAIKVGAGARQGPFERGSKSTRAVILAPTKAFGINFCFRRNSVATWTRVVYPIHPLP